MVPEGWKTSPIKDLCSSIIDCVNKTAPVVDYETPYKMIRTTNVRHGKVDTNNVRYVTKDTYTTWTRRGAPQNGDLVLTREAPVGEIGIINDATGVFLGQRTIMYRAHPTKSSNLFLLFALQTRNCKKQISDFSNGGTVAHMRVPDCGKINIITPPFQEQTKIAQILSTWDKAIKTTEQLIENSKTQKKALMQVLLTGKRRFPGFDKEWEQSKLSKHCKIKTGDKDLKNKIENGRYPFYVRSQNIEKIDSYSFDGEAILIPGDGRVGEIFHYINGKFDYHQRVYKLSDFNGIEGKFLYFYLQKFFKAEVVKHSVKATVDSLRMPVFTEMKINLPSPSEQNKISQTLCTADQTIEDFQRQLDNLKLEKTALLQQLLTGKRRVKLN